MLMEWDEAHGVELDDELQLPQFRLVDTKTSHCVRHYKTGTTQYTLYAFLIIRLHASPSLWAYFPFRNVRWMSVIFVAPCGSVLCHFSVKSWMSVIVVAQCGSVLCHFSVKSCLALSIHLRFVLPIIIVIATFTAITAFPTNPSSYLVRKLQYTFLNYVGYFYNFRCPSDYFVPYSDQLFDSTHSSKHPTFRHIQYFILRYLQTSFIQIIIVKRCHDGDIILNMWPTFNNSPNTCRPNIT